jgi:hypothetical protein
MHSRHIVSRAIVGLPQLTMLVLILAGRLSQCTLTQTQCGTIAALSAAPLIGLNTACVGPPFLECDPTTTCEADARPARLASTLCTRTWISVLLEQELIMARELTNGDPQGVGQAQVTPEITQCGHHARAHVLERDNLLVVHGQQHSGGASSLWWLCCQEVGKGDLLHVRMDCDGAWRGPT